MVCEFAEDCDSGSVRFCKISNRSICSTWNDDALVKNCPVRKDYLDGKPIGGMSDLGYVGVAHVIRKGKYGYFAPGMPFEYLRGNLKKKEEK